MKKSRRLAVNCSERDRWAKDIEKSVDLFNSWYLKFAPATYRDTRIAAVRQVEAALTWSENLLSLGPELLKEHPEILSMLRMATCPPLARDRLIGLSGASKAIVNCMERGRLPARMKEAKLIDNISRLSATIRRLIDEDVFPWFKSQRKPRRVEIERAATIIADRVCSAAADPIIRNAQERRQLSLIVKWLERRGYTTVAAGKRVRFDAMQPGTFGFRMNVPVKINSIEKPINIPIDAVVLPKRARKGELPLLIEAKSAGDFTNVNKRRKEEAAKMRQLMATYGERTRYILFLCNYFDVGYLGYEAAEGIDWVWEHRIDDLAAFGL
jgi:hypothetical protein